MSLASTKSNTGKDALYYIVQQLTKVRQHLLTLPTEFKNCELCVRVSFPTIRAALGKVCGSRDLAAQRPAVRVSPCDTVTNAPPRTFACPPRQLTNTLSMVNTQLTNAKKRQDERFVDSMEPVHVHADREISSAKSKWDEMEAAFKKVKVYVAEGFPLLFLRPVVLGLVAALAAAALLPCSPIASEPGRPSHGLRPCCFQLPWRRPEAGPRGCVRRLREVRRDDAEDGREGQRGPNARSEAETPRGSQEGCCGGKGRQGRRCWEVSQRGLNPLSIPGTAVTRKMSQGASKRRHTHTHLHRDRVVRNADVGPDGGRGQSLRAPRSCRFLLRGCRVAGRVARRQGRRRSSVRGLVTVLRREAVRGIPLNGRQRLLHRHRQHSDCDHNKHKHDDSDND